MTQIPCPLCAAPLRFSVARSRKAKVKKVFVMLVCPKDARHLRGFISDQTFVHRVVDGQLDHALDLHLDATGRGTGRE